MTLSSSPAEEQSSHLLRIGGLSKRFGTVQALTDVDLAIRGQEIVGIIGPNGAGKTTLLECLAGLLPADSGILQGRGTTLSRTKLKRMLFYLPDSISPYPGQCVDDVLEYCATCFAATRQELDDLIRALTLFPVRWKRVGELSKGYRRRLLLLIGLLSRAPLLLLDEPFDGLDPHLVRDVMALLRRAVTGGRTLLLSIHQLSDAERICDRFLLLVDGRVRGQGTLAELREQAGTTQGGLEEVFFALT